MSKPRRKDRMSARDAHNLVNHDRVGEHAADAMAAEMCGLEVDEYLMELVADEEERHRDPRDEETTPF